MLLAWCYFIIIVVGLYAFLYQFIQQPLKTIISCITVPLFIIQTASTIYTMAIDPMDLRIKRARVERNIDYVKVVGVPVIDPDTGYCGICRVQVGSGTKHCKVLVGLYDGGCLVGV